MSTPSIVTIRCGIHACDAVADHVRELGVVVDEVDWTVASPTSTLVVRTDAPERITTSELLRVLGTDIEVEADPSGADDPSGEDDPSGDDDRSSDDDLVDEIGRESFPTSDPPSTWAGPE